MRASYIIAALMIAAGLWYWFVQRHEAPGEAIAAAADTETVVTEPAAGRDAPVPVVVLPSTASETQGTLVIRGRTKANRTVQIASEISGRVISQAIASGARVEKGQVLCRLNPGVLAAELAEAEALLEEAEVEASAASRLKRKGFTAETTLKASQAELRVAQARLDRVKWNIAQLEIRAPFDGVLESDTAEVGTLMTPGAHCAELIDLSKVKVTGFVSEQEVDLLFLGQMAAARLINGVTADGTLSFLSRMSDEQTRTYAVEVTLENPDGTIRDGMTAELQIPLPSKTAHLLPHTALTLSDDGRMGVRIDEDGIARFYEIEVLNDTPEGIWVAGLPEDARVIVIGQEFVRDGRSILSTEASAAAQ
ncbi:MAG: efflux RND transporter periplasmic adaptor subunit [Pseudomonadota bacterium]